MPEDTPIIDPNKSDELLKQSADDSLNDINQIKLLMDTFGQILHGIPQPIVFKALAIQLVILAKSNKCSRREFLRSLTFMWNAVLIKEFKENENQSDDS